MSDKEPTNKIDVDFTSSRGLSEILVGLKISLVITTYQSGNIFFIGPDKNDLLAISAISHPRPMGICNNNGSLFIGGKNQVWRFNNILPPGQTHNRYDRYYVPQNGWTTGDLDIHDVCVDKYGCAIFVNTIHSCICSVSESHSFNIVWQPPWISEIAPEDRCHLNGLCLVDGKPAFVSAFSTSNKKELWRETKNESGIVYDIVNKKFVCEKLCMPHSPRWHDNNLWLLESGTGNLGIVDLQNKTFKPQIRIPGYLRGLTFHGDFAFVGSSLPREKSPIKNSPLEIELASQNEKQLCGVFIVNLKIMKVIGFIKISGDIQEIYDIAIISDAQKPTAIGLNDENLSYLLNIGNSPMP